MTALNADNLRIGGRYNWKNQPERLVYTGRSKSPGQHRWHQFEKVDQPGKVWCEVIEGDLHMLEETQELPKLGPRPDPNAGNLGRLMKQAAERRLPPPAQDEHPSITDAKRRAIETGKYTRTNGYSVTIFFGGELHHIFTPKGEELCTVTAPAGYYDTPGQPRVVDVQADALLAHLNREG